MNYKEYKYKNSKTILESEVIGYALFKSGYIKKDLTEIDPECIWCSSNKESMKDIAKKLYKKGEFFISKIHFSIRGNYLNEEQEFFTLP